MFREKIEQVLEKMVPDLAQCRAAADRLRAEHPSETSVQLARRAIQTARKTAAAAGATTGLVSNPMIMIPAALADMAAVLRIEGHLCGVIAALLDPEAMTTASIRSDVMGILFPGAVSQALRQVGIRAGERFGERLSRGLIRDTLAKDSAQTALKLVSRSLGLELTRKSILEKTAPILGAGIGAGWNWVEVGVVGDRAMHYYGFAHDPLLPYPGTAKRVKAVIRRWVGRPEITTMATPPPLPLPGPTPATGIS